MPDLRQIDGGRACQALAVRSARAESVLSVFPGNRRLKTLLLDGALLDVTFLHGGLLGGRFLHGSLLQVTLLNVTLLHGRLVVTQQSHAMGTALQQRPVTLDVRALHIHRRLLDRRLLDVHRRLSDRRFLDMHRGLLGRLLHMHSRLPRHANRRLLDMHRSLLRVDRSPDYPLARHPHRGLLNVHRSLLNLLGGLLNMHRGLLNMHRGLLGLLGGLLGHALLQVAASHPSKHLEAVSLALSKTERADDQQRRQDHAGLHLGISSV